MSKFAFIPLIRTFAMAAAVAAAGLALTSPAAAQPFVTTAQTCGAAHLAPAVEGDIITGFDDLNPADTNAASLRSRGIIVLTRSLAPVSAPAHGKVEYAGTVPNLGQVVILNIGHDFRVVLTGMDRVTVHTGETIDGGAQVGAMPAGRRDGAHFYMELRCGEEPVTPAGATLIAMQ